MAVVRGKSAKKRETHRPRAEDSGIEKILKFCGVQLVLLVAAIGAMTLDLRPFVSETPIKTPQVATVTESQRIAVISRLQTGLETDVPTQLGIGDANLAFASEEAASSPPVYLAQVQEHLVVVLTIPILDFQRYFCATMLFSPSPQAKETHTEGGRLNLAKVQLKDKTTLGSAKTKRIEFLVETLAAIPFRHTQGTRETGISRKEEGYRGFLDTLNLRVKANTLYFNSPSVIQPKESEAKK